MKIATVHGIGVYIHWTFWLLIAFYLISSSLSGGIAAGLFAVAFIGCVFACVVAHEFGHAAAAAHFGIRTSDITLLPIGGVARLMRLPDSPIQELVIAVAGPAVNVAIAAALVLLIGVGLIPSGLGTPGPEVPYAFLDYILMANVVLVLFNMLPAFPMDGGRVLRSLLAMWTGHLRATEIAARVGRWMALLFALLAIYYGELMLLLVAGFVFLAGTAELMAVRVRSMAADMQGTTAGGGSPGGAYVRWHTNVWPQEATTYAWGDAQASARPDQDGVIDALEVRRIPRDGEQDL